jgi:hypothetical protein
MSGSHDSPAPCQGRPDAHPYDVRDLPATAIGRCVTTSLPDGLPEFAEHVLAFEHERPRHDRTKEAEIRVTFDMSPARYYQVLNRLIDTPAALASDPQLVNRLQRLRSARTSARAARRFVAPNADGEGREEER